MTIDDFLKTLARWKKEKLPEYDPNAKKRFQDELERELVKKGMLLMAQHQDALKKKEEAEQTIQRLSVELMALGTTQLVDLPGQPPLEFDVKEGDRFLKFQQEREKIFPSSALLYDSANLSEESDDLLSYL